MTGRGIRAVRWGLAGILAGAFCLQFFWQTQSVCAAQQSYPVQAPQVIDDWETAGQIRKMAQQYPEFQEVYDHLDSYPEKLLKALCSNPEIIDFVKGYPEADGKAHGGITPEEMEETVPLLLQWDKRWGYVPYGDDMIALSGCAPTCLSMVILSLTGNEKATPDALAKEAGEGGYYAQGVGTSWTFLKDGCRKYGVTGEELMLDKEAVFAQLDRGHLIICSMRQGDFTTEGHFIVITEADGEMLRIHDPNCRARSDWTWDYEVLEPQIKNLWTYSKTEDMGENETED